MKHHLQRAKQVYEERGGIDLTRTALSYLPIEINNLIFRFRYGRGTEVMEEDWDTLILLDGCRYDMFESHVPFDGKMESRISLGSTSEEFLERNFSSGKFHDTVYVNANVYFPKLELDRDQTFHAVVDLLDEWDEELEIAHPETVTKAAINAHDHYPEKRIIVHYMQPHIPFIGRQGRELQKEVGSRNVWIPFREGRRPISIQEVWDGYNENLEVVFKYVDELLSEVRGKIVISADHGNMVEDRQGPIPTKRMYGHPWGVYSPELVKVPWFVLERGERRRITSEPPTETQGHSKELVSERLQALGYQE